MKKFRMILAVVLAMLLLVGCGGSGKTDNGGQINQNPPCSDPACTDSACPDGSTRGDH